MENLFKYKKNIDDRQQIKEIITEAYKFVKILFNEEKSNLIRYIDYQKIANFDGSKFRDAFYNIVLRNTNNLEDIVDENLKDIKDKDLKDKGLTGVQLKLKTLLISGLYSDLKKYFDLISNDTIDFTNRIFNKKVRRFISALISFLGSLGLFEELKEILELINIFLDYS